MTTIDRRRIPVSDDALGLFIGIEKGPPAGRKAYSDESRRLALMLDLFGEWLTGNHVNDARAQSHMTRQYISFHDFQRCREVRTELLRLAQSRGLL